VGSFANKEIQKLSSLWNPVAAENNLLLDFCSLNRIGQVLEIISLFSANSSIEFIFEIN